MEWVTHVVQTAPRMRNLNNLQTRLLPIQPIRPTANIARLESLFQRRLHSILKTQHSRTRLVEVLNERDVEVGHVLAQPEVDVCEG